MVTLQRLYVCPPTRGVRHTTPDVLPRKVAVVKEGGKPQATPLLPLLRRSDRRAAKIVWFVQVLVIFSYSGQLRGVVEELRDPSLQGIPLSEPKRVLGRVRFPLGVFQVIVQLHAVALGLFVKEPEQVL